MAWKHVRARTGPVCHCVSVLGVSSKCWHMSPLGNVPSPHSPSHLTVLTTSPHILQVRPSRLASISSEILPPMSPFLGDHAPPITPALLHPSPPLSSPNILFSSFSSFFPFSPSRPPPSSPLEPPVLVYLTHLIIIRIAGSTWDPRIPSYVHKTQFGSETKFL